MTDSLPRPPYDPELAEVLDTMPADQPRSITPEMIAEVRASTASWAPPLADMLAGRDISHTEHTVPGPSGAPELTLSIFTHTDPEPTAAAISYIHGGGMIAGHRHVGPQGFFDLIEQQKIVLVSSEYRLAPEHPYPAPIEDCYAALLWTVEQSAQLGIDPSRLLLAGESAGGGLAAGVALLIRDRGGPTLAGQLLLSPMLDDRNTTISSRQYDGVHIWDRTSNQTGWDALLGEGHEHRDIPPYAAPGRVADLSGLPPAFIDVGSAEVFRDEDVAYASQIWAAGGQAELHVWPGGFHGFQGMAARAALSASALQAAHAWTCRTLGL